MITVKRILLVLIVFMLSVYVYSQSSAAESDKGHFGGIYLGMTLDQVKDALEKDGNFHFTGDPDISILHRPNETLIECSGTFYITRAFFQFYKERLYTITLMLSREDLDHYSVYTELTGKYGDPSELDPQKSVWIFDKYILSLERPLSVKYIDKEALEKIRTSVKSEKTLQELSRKEFLDQF